MVGSENVSALSPVARRSTPDLIAERLREAIGKGELAAGTHLTEAQLAAVFGVSRGPLREAMQRLTQEGLLLAHRNRGIVVKEMTPAEITDMYIARAVVEQAAAMLLIDGVDGAGARLAGIVERMATAAEVDDRPRLSDLDLEFHDTLVTLASSPRLSRMHRTLMTETRICLRRLEDRYETPTDRVDEHARIAEAIRTDDAAAAGTLIIEHMEDGLDRLGIPAPFGWARITRQG